MIDVSTPVVVLVMFGGLLLAIMTGFPIAWALGGIAVICGALFWGPGSFPGFYMQTFGALSNYVLLAVPLFVFMGVMVERTGIGERLFKTAYVLFAGIRGGLAVTVVIVGVLLACSLGIIAGSIVMLTVVALPTLVAHGYNKEMSCGTIMASGSLGIFIPPSVLLVIYGPVANISVGRLFMAAFMPGFMLGGIYITYVLLRSFINPQFGPSIPREERVVSLLTKARMFITSGLPLLVLILSVLGVIYAGVATPTEASAIGALAATIMAVAYGNMNFEVLKDATRRTLKVTSMIIFTLIGSVMFQIIFLGLGGGDFFSEVVMLAPFGKWGTFAVMMLIIFFLGFFIVDLAIILIMVPLVTPVGAALGFDPLWFAMMVCMNIQISYLTPPFAQAIFFLKGAADPNLGITSGHIMRGVIPFVCLISLGMVVCIIFPQIITWLPSTMIK